jgi:hypothetical protein
MFYSSCRAFAGILLSALLFAGCKPKPGDKCSGSGLPSCSDPATALVCANGVVTALPCRGAKACTVSGSTVECDNSLANVNDACDQPNDVACAVDHKFALECQNGKFALAETCKGARGCVVDGDKISCDNDVADLGDPCQTEGDYACTADKLMALKCTAHKFEALNTCRGEEACNMDKTALFTCKANHFAKDRPCPGGCSFDDKGERFLCAPEATPPTGAVKLPAKAPAPSKLPAKPSKPAAKPGH